MKKSILIIPVFTFCLYTISCKKDKDSTPQSTTPATSSVTPCGGVFCYTDGSTAVVADSANAVLYTNSVSHSRVIDVYVFKGGSQVMEMHFNPKTGSQVVDTSATFSKAWLTFQTPTDYCDGTSGDFNLTVCDTVGGKLTGTFNFSGKMNTSQAVKTITNGNINISSIKKQ
jgi:hypothetical protein